MTGVTSLMPGSEADSPALIWLYVTKWPCLLRRHGSGLCRGVALRSVPSNHLFGRGCRKTSFVMKIISPVVECFWIVPNRSYQMVRLLWPWDLVRDDGQLLSWIGFRSIQLSSVDNLVMLDVRNIPLSRTMVYWGLLVSSNLNIPRLFPWEKRTQKLTDVCQLMGMDFLRLVFYHADLGRNIIVEDVPKGSTIGIIDWEISGYVQYSGLDLPHPGAGEESHSEVTRETWRRHGGIETLL